jgi:thiol-disulfide isomerase/thioredoxin
MKPSIILILPLFILSGCIISFNSDHYKTLKKKEKAAIKSNYFALKDIQPFDQIELHPNELERLSQNFNSTLIYFFQPWCSPCIEDLKKMILKEKEYRKDSINFKLIVVSYSYQRKKEIENLYTRLNYLEPIFVMPNNPFGDKLREKGDKYISEFSKYYPNQSIKSDIVLIKSNKIIFQTYKLLNEDTLDLYVKTTPPNSD